MKLKKQIKEGITLVQLIILLALVLAMFATPVAWLLNLI